MPDPAGQEKGDDAERDETVTNQAQIESGVDFFTTERHEGECGPKGDESIEADLEKLAAIQNHAGEHGNDGLLYEGEKFLSGERSNGCLSVVGSRRYY